MCYHLFIATEFDNGICLIVLFQNVYMSLFIYIYIYICRHYHSFPNGVFTSMVTTLDIIKRSGSVLRQREICSSGGLETILN